MKSDLSEKVLSGLPCCPGCMVPNLHSEQWGPKLPCRGLQKEQILAPAISSFQLTKPMLFFFLNIGLNKACCDLLLLEKYRTK